MSRLWKWFYFLARIFHSSLTSTGSEFPGERCVLELSLTALSNCFIHCQLTKPQTLPSFPESEIPWLWEGMGEMLRLLSCPRAEHRDTGGTQSAAHGHRSRVETPGVCPWVIYTWARAAQRVKGGRRLKPSFWKEQMGFVLNVRLHGSLAEEKCGFSLLCEKL